MNDNLLKDFAIIILIVTNCITSPALSQPVGSMKRVVNDVSAKIAGSTRALKTQSSVNANEAISAKQDSHGEILLQDSSKIIVGPGASIKLDKFLIADEGLKSGTLNLAKGAFRFISSKSKKKAKFNITTPLATIGIRGTAFDVYVREKGITDVVLFSGKVEVCTHSGRCKLVESQCDIVRVSSRNNIESLQYLRSGDRKQENTDYNLTNRQLRFPLGWQAPTFACSARAYRENRGRIKIEIEDETHCVARSTPTPPDPEPLAEFDC